MYWLALNDILHTKALCKSDIIGLVFTPDTDLLPNFTILEFCTTGSLIFIYDLLCFFREDWKFQQFFLTGFLVHSSTGHAASLLVLSFIQTKRTKPDKGQWSWMRVRVRVGLGLRLRLGLGLRLPVSTNRRSFHPSRVRVGDKGTRDKRQWGRKTSGTDKRQKTRGQSGQTTRRQEKQATRTSLG